ncbi:MAG: PKD domain-containing protein [Myxococcota bacterium]
MKILSRFWMVTLAFLVSAPGWTPAHANGPLVLSETEPNGSQATANAVVGFGSAANPEADVAGSIGGGDEDYFTVDLAVSDVFVARVSGDASEVTLFDVAGAEVMGSRFDRTPLLPPGSPLDEDGNASVFFVVRHPGTYAVRVSDGAGGAYELGLRAFRAPLESAAPASVQTIWVDFNGATVDPDAFLVGDEGIVEPLVNLLPRWGLTSADEDAVIDAILAKITELLRHDINLLGGNPNSDIRILNSRDHDDPFPGPHVSRIVIGGNDDMRRAGANGAALYYDVGNFLTAETAVVAVDLLSEPAGLSTTLNSIPLDPSKTMIDLIGHAVGIIASHEAGHMLGNFHTKPGNGTGNVMDGNGSLNNTLGLGADGKFGTPDDVVIDFGVDTYQELYTGDVDTGATIAGGLHCPDGSGGDACAPPVNLLANLQPLDSPLLAIAGSTVLLGFNAPDPDGLGFPIFESMGFPAPITVVWNFGGGTTANPLDIFNPAPSVTFDLAAPGGPSETLDLSAQVYDGSANSTIAPFQVVVTEAPDASVWADGHPVTGPLTIWSGESISFQVIASDEDDLGYPIFAPANPSPVSWQWDFDGGTGSVPLSIFAPNPVVTFTGLGTYNVQVTVWDTLGASTTVPVTVNVVD